MALRIIKILLVFSIAAWALVNAVGNIMFYDEWIKIVAHVMAVENVQYDGHPSGRAMNSPVLHTIGYAFIYLPKFITGILCLIAVNALWKARRDTAINFEKAKYYFYVGCGVSIFSLIFGFLVVAGAMFSPGGKPSELVQGFHSFVSVYVVSIGMALLFVAIPEPKEGQ
ncbi:MAG TPA: DUF2165 family protein [Cellvibrio sp.]